MFNVRPTTTTAHRFSYALAHGVTLDSIPFTSFVCHHCDNRKCVRPDHLFLGTQSENLRDCASKGRFATPARRNAEAARRGELNPKSRLNTRGVRYIRAAHRRGDTKAAIARRLGVGETTVSHVLTGRTWRHVA
jgi:hypothetical protein